MKKVCKTCGYWTGNSKDKKLKCYTNECPTKQASNRARSNYRLLQQVPIENDGWVKPKKVYFIPKAITVQIPHCPKCREEISVITDPDFKTIASYYCEKCKYVQ